MYLTLNQALFSPWVMSPQVSLFSIQRSSEECGYWQCDPFSTSIAPPASLPCPPTQPFPTPIPLQRKPGQPRRNSYGARGSNSQAVSFLRPSHQVPLSTNPQRYLLPINIPLPTNLFTSSTTDLCGTHPMSTPSSKLSIKLNSTNIY